MIGFSARKAGCVAVWAAVLFASPASADELHSGAAADPRTAPKLPAQDVTPDLKAGTLLDLEIDQVVSSRTSKDGDQFPLHLAEPVLRDGVILIPAGTRGVGEVIHVGHAGLAGRPGELIITARYLDCGGVHLPLGHFRYGRTGQDNTNLSVAATIAVGVVGVLIVGGDVKVPVGTRGNARLTTDVNLRPAPLDKTAAAPSATSTGGPHP